MTLVMSTLRVYSSCILNCKHMTLAIGMLNDNFPLHANKMQNCHLKYPNARMKQH